MNRVCALWVLPAALCLALLAPNAIGSMVYLLGADGGEGSANNGDAAISAVNTAMLNALVAQGHTVTLGVRLDNPAFSGVDLTSYDVVVLNKVNGDGSAQTVPDATGNVLSNFVASGRGLVTLGWVYYPLSGATGPWSDILPGTNPNWRWGNVQYQSWTCTVVTADAVLNAGLSNPFAYIASYHGGSGDGIVPRSGATTFYSTTAAFSPAYPDAVAVAGWQYGSAGRVISFSSIGATTSIGDSSFAKLVGNAVTWATPVPEPATLAIVLAGLAGLARLIRRRVQ
jgi:hypothetical protein